MQQAPGKTMIKVVGILLIVFGAIGALTGIISAVGGAALGAYTGSGGISSGARGIAAAASGMLVVLGIISVVGGAIDLIFGIISVRACGDVNKAGQVIVCGWILAALTVVSSAVYIVISMAMLSGIEGAANPVQSVFSLIIGLILPALLIVGGKRNKDAQISQ